MPILKVIDHWLNKLLNNGKNEYVHSKLRNINLFNVTPSLISSKL